MCRWLAVPVLALLATGCNAPRAPDRLVFGVSGDRPAGASSVAADDEMRQFLDWRINQICTLGYDTVKVETLPAEENKQLVDEEVRCRDYRLSLF
jgi:hypothetical protein